MQLIVVIVSLAIGAAYFYGTGRIFVSPFADPSGPRAFPYLLVALLVLGCVVLFLEWFRSDRKPLRAYGIGFWPLVPIAVWTLLYILAFEPLGFMLSTVIYLLPLMWIFNPGKQIANIVTAVGFPVVTFWILNGLLQAQLPTGTLLRTWFGI